MVTFSTIGINLNILKNLSSMGFQRPTPVQEKVIPFMLEDERDMIVLSQTGTGKTAAFGLPLIQLTDTHDRQTKGLVLCPTRELCLQVAKDMESFTGHSDGPRILAVYGGASIADQIRALKRGVHIIVATPGRLNDLINRRKVDLSAVENLIFDEADEMLKMGFQDEINSILARTPSDKNTLLFSATMSSDIKAIAGKYMRRPLEVTIGRKNACSENVTHEYYVVNSKNRYPVLRRIVDNSPEIYSIVFCRTKHETQAVASKLIGHGYRADAIHGDLSQAQRDQVMKKFRERQLQILVATDVAARGLDVNDLTHVIHYNLPDDIAGYTHRSGRTGRAGRSGISLSLVNSGEQFRIRRIEKNIQKKFKRCKIPTGMDICRRQLIKFSDNFAASEVNQALVDTFITEFSARLSHMDRDEILKKIISRELQDLFRFYSDSPDFNTEPASQREPRSTKYKGKKRSGSQKNHLIRFHIDAGKRSGVMPQAILGQINRNAGDERIRVKRIEIMRNSAILEADSRYKSKIMAAFKDFSLNGRPVSIAVAADREKKKRIRHKKTGRINKQEFKAA